MRHTLFCLLVLVSACSKKDDKSAPEAKTTEPAPTAVPAKSADVKPAVAAPAGVSLVSGDATLGCVGWSAKSKSAACLTGEIGSGGEEVSLTFVPSGAPVKLGAKLDDAMVTAANAALVEYTPFTKVAPKVARNAAVDVGNMVALRHQVSETKKGGDNVAPTAKHQVLAICGTNTTTVYEVEEEGLGLSVAYQPVEGGTIVEITTDLGREGEFSKGFLAKFVDDKCQVK